ncbi:MAG: ADP-ribosylglycohydrolase family protein [Solirubrobacteraceae bacterium]
MRPVDERVLDRARGVLLGLAIGDALGGPLELMTQQEIQSRYDEPVADYVGGGWLSLQPGEGTDDTAMAFALARSMASSVGYDADRALAGYLEWFRTDPPDVGNTIRAALAGVSAGRAASEVTEEYHRMTGKSAGNGTLMRVAPIAVRHLREPERRAQAARTDSKLTHFDDHAASACALFCDGIASLMCGVDVSELAAPESLAHEWAPTREAAAREAAGEKAGYVGTALMVASTALVSAQTFEEGLTWAVNLGGDADTNGAVAGALLGARFGEAGIPTRWLDGLLAAEEARALADRLLELAETTGGWDAVPRTSYPHRRSSGLSDLAAELEAKLAPFRGQLEHNPDSRLAAELLISRSGVFRHGPMLVSNVPKRNMLYVHERAYAFDDLEPNRSVEICDGVRLMLDLNSEKCVGFTMQNFSSFDFEAPANAAVWRGPRFDVPPLGIEQGTVGLIAATARLVIGSLRTPDRVLFDQAVAAGKGEKALLLWQACLEEGNELARYALGYTLLALGRPLEAREQLKHYSSIVRRNAWAWCYLGQACEQLEDWEQAEYSYRQSITATQAGALETDAPGRLADLLRRRSARA